MKPLFHLPVLLLLCWVTTVSASDLKPQASIETPPLNLPDMTDKMHNLKDYAGQVVLVQFWATYCPPCIKEMPSMNRLMEKMGETPFKILAVNMGEPKDDVVKFAEQVKPEFTILMDESGESIAQWQVFAAPSSFIIGADGKVHYTMYGATEWDSDDIVNKLKSLSK